MVGDGSIRVEPAELAGLAGSVRGVAGAVAEVAVTGAGTMRVSSGAPGSDRVIIAGHPASPDAIYFWDHINPPFRIWP